MDAQTYALISVGSTHAKVDHEDAPLVEGLRWHVVAGYAVHSRRVGPRKAGKVEKVWMHRLILGLDAWTPRGLEVDHDNGDRLDNRRSNLTVCTRTRNMQNRAYGYGTSQYRGVHLRANGRWLAQGSAGGKKCHIGVFDTETAAAQAARDWRVKHIGPHAA